MSNRPFSRAVRQWRMAPALALAMGLVGFTAAAASTWQSAKAVALPAGSSGLYQGQFSSLSCPAATTCAATGIYLAASGEAGSFAADEVNGTWKKPSVLVAPPGASTHPNLSIYASSCGASGDCVAVGNYTDAKLNVWPVVVSERNGRWLQGVKITLPTGAPANESGAILRDVSCTKVGQCSGVGTYYDASPNFAHTLGFVVSEVHGAWKKAVQITLPSDANANPLINVNQISCAAPGQCSAVGSYITNNSVTTAIAINQVNGAWRPATVIALPGDASAYAGASLSAVDCAASGTCTAIGTYNTSAGGVATMVVSESGNTWGRALHLAMPVGAATNPRPFFYGFRAMSCANSTNCAAGGQYVDSSGDYQGFLVRETSGKWGRATEMPLPAGASMAGHNGGVVSVTCPTPTRCSAGGAYLDASGNYQATILSSTTSGWSGARVSLPGGATTVGIDGGLYALSCPTTGPCTAIGSYLAGTTKYQGFTISTR